jgi:hypothetical protein
MPRQSHEVAHISLRLREPLRAKLEREAKRHRFSINNEIRIRLEDSFTRDDIRKLGDIADDMEVNWMRYSNRYMLLSLEDDLAAALAKSTDPEVSKLARLWLHHREHERRLTEGGAS